mgnify:CR=1 FL=1
MKEIGRLREIAFRAAGGGTGKAMDIDEYDVMENPYKQLVVWNPEAEGDFGMVIVIFWGMRCNLMNMGSLCWLLLTCLISRKFF